MPQGRLPVVLLMLVAGSANAAEQGAPAASTGASIYAGLEVGNTETHRLLAGGSLRWRDHWELDAQLSRAEFDLPEGAVTSATSGALLSYDFGQFTANVGYRRGEMRDISTTSGWVLGGSYERETLRFSLEMESRGTRLEPTPFTEDLGEDLGVQSGTSQCDVDSRGFQARMDLNRPTWLGFIAYKAYDYQDFDCALTLDDAGGGGPPPHARGRALGRRLGEIALQPVSGFASRLVPREAMLLDWSASLGVTLPIAGRWIGGAELYHDQERGDGGAFDTALVFASRDLDDTWNLELSAGFSDADGVADTAFAGVRMSASL